MLNKLETEIKAIMLKYPETRDDDNLLYKHYLVNHYIPLVSVIEFFGNYSMYKNKYNIAELESVGRVRRKLQETNSDLQPSYETGRIRKEVQISFEEYARQK